MIDRRTFLAAASAAVLIGARSHGSRRSQISLQVFNNRPYVSLELIGRNHKTRDVFCLLDTGGGSFMVTKEIATAIDLETTGPVQSNGDQRFQSISPPRVLVSGTEVSIPSDSAMVALAGPTIEPGVRAQAFLPGRLLRQHRVLFDYPGRTFSLDDPSNGEGAVTLPVSVDPHSGFLRIETRIDGQAVSLLLDTGASFTMLSRAFIDSLSAKHPDWKSVPGAFCAANMVGNKMELDAKMLRIPQVDIGSMVLRDVVAVSRPTGTFEKWMSTLSGGPIVGALGGNALRNLRLQIDYPQMQVEAVHTDVPVAHEFDMVPLILTPTYTHGYLIAGVLPGAKFSVPHEQLIGKTLLSVDDTAITAKNLTEVFDALRGVPGTTHALRVGTPSGATVTLEATVTHII